VKKSCANKIRTAKLTASQWETGNSLKEPNVIWDESGPLNQLTAHFHGGRALNRRIVIESIDRDYGELL
jgi:hypothetical protein